MGFCTVSTMLSKYYGVRGWDLAERPERCGSVPPALGQNRRCTNPKIYLFFYFFLCYVRSDFYLPFANEHVNQLFFCAEMYEMNMGLIYFVVKSSLFFITFLPLFILYNLFYFISFHFISFYFILFHFISFHFISFHFISFHFILFYFILFYFILFYSII
jgi:hypothetical protein